MPTAITFDYKVGLKKQISEAFKAAWLTVPDARYNDIYVGLEWPLEQIDYPRILINYEEGPLRNAGVGSLDMIVDENSSTVQVRHFLFTGNVNFNVLALTPLDRDNVSSILINILALGRNMDQFVPFYEQIENGKYLQLHFMSDTIQPSGEQTSPAPWGDEDTLVHWNRYIVPIFGEFWSDAYTGELIEISNVDIYPYEAGTPAPW